jgi:hypothetical protein
MFDLTTNRYSSHYRENGIGEYRGVKYELKNMGLLWRIRSGVGQFFGETSSDAMIRFKQIVDSNVG